MFALAMLVASCGKNEEKKGSVGKLKAVSTITIINDIVKNIGGDKVDAVSICGVGVDPHTYHPKPSDPRLVSECDIVFINGMGLEHWM